MEQINKLYSDDQKKEISTVVANGKVDDLHKLLTSWRPALTRGAAISLYYAYKRKNGVQHTIRRKQHYTKTEMKVVRKLFTSGHTDKQILEEIRKIRPSAGRNTVKCLRRALHLYRRRPPKKLGARLNTVPLTRSHEVAEITVKTSKAEFRQIVNSGTAKTIIELLMGL